MDYGSGSRRQLPAGSNPWSLWPADVRWGSRRTNSAHTLCLFDISSQSSIRTLWPDEAHCSALSAGLSVKSPKSQETTEMINRSKIHELDAHFPLLAVENGCILSKDADVTVAYEVTLPEIFTVSGTEYEEMNSLWHKAIKTLPKFTIVHKQDWYVRESYKPDFVKTDNDDESVAFLSRAGDLHFAERPYLDHKCYLLSLIHI